MSVVNNLVACSRLASDKRNEFDFSCQYPTSIVIPKTVTLTKAVINNTLNTFKDGCNVFYITLNGSSPQQVLIPNTYYNTVRYTCACLLLVPVINNESLFEISQLKIDAACFS